MGDCLPQFTKKKKKKSLVFLYLLTVFLLIFIELFVHGICVHPPLNVCNRVCTNVWTNSQGSYHLIKHTIFSEYLIQRYSHGSKNRRKKLLALPKLKFIVKIAKLISNLVNHFAIICKIFANFKQWF